MELPPFTCPVCQSSFNDRIIATETSERGTVQIRQCSQCSLYVTWPRLADSQAYFQVTAEQWESKYGAIDRGERTHDRHNNYLEEVAIMGEYLRDGCILDVGCNAGWLLGYLQQEGRYEIEGVEPSQELAAIARRRLGITIHNCYLHQVGNRSETFDGIVATDVIEHIPPEDIHQFLQSLTDLLKPGGYCFIKTPNAKFTALKSAFVSGIPLILRSFLVKGLDVWDAKEHLIHWDATTLPRILKSYGLSPIRALTPRPVESFGSPMAARIARKLIYKLALSMNGQHRTPLLAQDVFFIARKDLCHRS